MSSFRLYTANAHWMNNKLDPAVQFKSEAFLFKEKFLDQHVFNECKSSKNNNKLGLSVVKAEHDNSVHRVALTKV